MTERRDRIRVHIEGKEFNVVGGVFTEMLAAVKQIAGRRFVSELKVWQLPGAAEDIQHQLSISGYELEGGTPIDQTDQPSTPAPSVASDRIRIKVGDYQLAVIGGTFQEMLDTVKKLPGRRFDGASKIWEIPGDPLLVKGVIEAAGFQLEGIEQLPAGDVPPMEPLSFAEPDHPPTYEPPDFGEVEEASDYEPPDWWDDDSMPPPLEPEDWDDEAANIPPEEPPLSDNVPSSFTPPAPPEVSAPPAATGDRIRLRIGDTSFVVSGGTFQAMLAAIKNIPGRRFNGQEKVWEIPDDVTVDSVDQAMTDAGFMLMPE